MGTTYSIQITAFPNDEARYTAMSQAIEAELNRLNLIFSTYDSSSELSLLNSMEQTTPIPVSHELMQVLQVSKVLYESTHGLFDPTVAPLVRLWGFGARVDRDHPPLRTDIEAVRCNVGFDKVQLGPGQSVTKTLPGVQIDLSSNAKGYIVDKVYDLLILQGYRDVLVEIGGELRLRGHDKDGQPWRVGMDAPLAEGEMLELSSGAVATSGVYRNSFEYQGERYSHLIDPHTGYPIESTLVSVTVLAPTCLEADGAATAIMIQGPDQGFEWVSEQFDLQALLLSEDGSVDGLHKMTPGFASHLVQ